MLHKLRQDRGVGLLGILTGSRIKGKFTGSLFQSYLSLKIRCNKWKVTFSVDIFGDLMSISRRITIFYLCLLILTFHKQKCQANQTSIF